MGVAEGHVADVIRKVLYLRQTYHFGPRRIAAYLARFHRQAICRLLRTSHLGSTRLESAPGQSEAPTTDRRWQRYEKPQPGQRVQLDVKFLERIPGTN